jgi:hypothetical protein
MFIIIQHNLSMIYDFIVCSDARVLSYTSSIRKLNYKQQPNHDYISGLPWL